MFEKEWLRRKDVEYALRECGDLESDYSGSQFIYGYRTAIANMKELLSNIEGMTADVCYNESLKKYIDERAKDVERNQLMQFL